MIVMNDLVAGYDRQPVTRALSGVIERGSMTAIVGANGCGKSTLLKTLAGFLPPVSGTFRWQGRRPVVGCPHAHCRRAGARGAGVHGVLHY